MAVTRRVEPRWLGEGDKRARRRPHPIPDFGSSWQPITQEDWWARREIEREHVRYDDDE